MQKKLQQNALDGNPIEIAKKIFYIIKNSSRGNLFPEPDSPANSKTHSWKSIILTSAICIIFVTIGAYISYLGISQHLANQNAAETWIETPCEIVSAELETSSSNKRTKYSPKITYRYTFAGNEYSGSKLQILMELSSNDFDEEKRRLEKLGKQKFCYVNPSVPAESILTKPTKNFLPEQTVIISCGLLCFSIGTLLSVGTLCAVFNKPKGKQKSVPGELKHDAPSSMFLNCFSTIFLFFFGIIWALGTFLKDGIILKLVVIPIGIAFLISVFIATRKAFRFFNPRYQMIISREKKPESEKMFELSWKIILGNARTIRSFELNFLAIQADEDLTVNGRPMRKVVAREKIFESQNSLSSLEDSCKFTVPANFPETKFYAVELLAKTTFPLRPSIRERFYLKK